MTSIRLLILGKNRMLADGLRQWMATASDVAIVEPSRESDHTHLENQIASVQPPPEVIVVCTATDDEISDVVSVAPHVEPCRIAVVGDPASLSSRLSVLVEHAISVIGPTVKRCELTRAIALLASGAVVVDRLVIGSHGQNNGPAMCTAEHAVQDLTFREREIFRRLAFRETNREIANELHLSEKTVRNYVSNILRKLQVDNRIAAGQIAAGMNDQDGG